MKVSQDFYSFYCSQDLNCLNKSQIIRRLIKVCTRYYTIIFNWNTLPLYIGSNSILFKVNTRDFHCVLFFTIKRIRGFFLSLKAIINIFLILLRVFLSIDRNVYFFRICLVSVHQCTFKNPNRHLVYRVMPQNTPLFLYRSGQIMVEICEVTSLASSPRFLSR